MAVNLCLLINCLLLLSLCVCVWGGGGGLFLGLWCDSWVLSSLSVQYVNVEFPGHTHFFFFCDEAHLITQLV